LFIVDDGEIKLEAFGLNKEIIEENKA
jgi:hypothetical protein